MVFLFRMVLAKVRNFQKLSKKFLSKAVTRCRQCKLKQSNITQKEFPSQLSFRKENFQGQTLKIPIQAVVVPQNQRKKFLGLLLHKILMLSRFSTWLTSRRKIWPASKKPTEISTWTNSMLSWEALTQFHK